MHFVFSCCGTASPSPALPAGPVAAMHLHPQPGVVHLTPGTMGVLRRFTNIDQVNESIANASRANRRDEDDAGELADIFSALCVIALIGFSLYATCDSAWEVQKLAGCVVILLLIPTVFAMGALYYGCEENDPQKRQREVADAICRLVVHVLFITINCTATSMELPVAALGGINLLLPYFMIHPLRRAVFTCQN